MTKPKDMTKKRISYYTIWDKLEELKLDVLCNEQNHKKASQIRALQDKIDKANYIPNENLDKLITSFHIKLYE